MSSQQSDDTTQQKDGKGTFGEFLSNAVKTPGVRNIEAAYSRAGASNHHTPGSASKLGSQDQQGASAYQGVGSQRFADGISNQRSEVRFEEMNRIRDKTDALYSLLPLERFSTT